jgi:hypothetical protein
MMSEAGGVHAVFDRNYYPVPAGTLSLLDNIFLQNNLQDTAKEALELDNIFVCICK